MFRKLFCLIAAILCCAATFSPVYAQDLIAYEGFNYTVGNLNGQNGGSGWLTGNSWAGGGTNTVVAGGLTYTDTLGNQLLVSGNHAFATGQNGSADPFRALQTARNGTDGAVTWLSFIAQREQPHSGAQDNIARVASLQLRTGGSERLAIGKPSTNPPNASSPTGNQFNWGMYPNNMPSSGGYSQTPQWDQAFLVVKVSHVGDTTVADTAELWVNPVLSADESSLGAPSVTVTSQGANDFSFDRIQGFIGNTNMGAGGLWAELSFDEIRVGRTFNSVTPIFDPNLLRSDFDGDTYITLADFEDLRGNFLTGTTHAQGDANFDGVVNHQDFFLWRTDYLAGGGSLSDFSFSFAVPEPSAGIATSILALCAASLRTRHRTAR